MNKQPTDIPLSGSAWQLLDKLDTTLNSKLPLADKLQEAIYILIDSLNVDALWCATVSPLPSLACGAINTPTSMAPKAKIAIVDRAPSTESNPTLANTALMQIVDGKKLDLLSADSGLQAQIDADLCDASFKAFHIVPVTVVPIATKENRLGAMVVGLHKNRGNLSTEQHNLLLYLGKHLGQYLLNTYLADRATQHAHTLDILNQISRTITSSLEIDDVIQKTMAGINTLLNVEAGSLLLQDPNTNELYFKITLRGENKQVTSYRLRPDEGVAGWVVANNQPAIVNQPSTDKRFSNKIDLAIGFTTHNILCVPLVVKGKASGALELVNKRSGPFDDADQELLVSMAASLGVALNNALHYEDARTRAYQSEVFNQITTAINSGHGLSDTAGLIFRQFSRLFSFDHITFTLIDTVNNKVKQWTFDETASIEETKASIPLQNSKLAQVITHSQGFVENNLFTDSSNGPQYPDMAVLKKYSISSIAAVPLATQTTPYGCLCLGSRENEIYGIKQLNTLEKLAPQIAVVLEKALLIDATEKRAAEMQQLNRLGEMLASTIDIKLITNTTIAMLPRILSSEIHGVAIAGEEGAYAGLAVPSGFWRKDPIIQEIFNTLLEMQARPVPVELITIKTIVTEQSVSPDWKPEANLILPILTRQGTQGVIYAASSNDEFFDDDFLRVFSLIVSQISAAVENALLFQQVEQERARLAAILASTTDAVLVVNRKGRIVLDNPAAREILNVTESQSGRLLTESTSLQPLIRLFEGAVQGGETTGEIPLKDNRTFHASLSPVSVGETGTIGWVATMQDISHFKELDELKNEFVGTVSHDLRSPLSSILIATKLIEQAGEINSDQQQLITMVERRIQGMSELIDDLLDVGHIEAGVDMNLEPCNVAEIVNDVTTELTSQAEDKEIELTTTIAENIPPMLANETRLQQIVHNLVGNAIKYTPNGGTVTVKAYPHKNEVRVQVIDTGLGIPASDQPHIFEKFYRVRGEHVLGIKGTGLGLAIVKSIIDRLNGRIWLESVFGQGSTFTVAFPISTETKQ